MSDLNFFGLPGIANVAAIAALIVFSIMARPSMATHRHRILGATLFATAAIWLIAYLMAIGFMITVGKNL